MRTSSLIRTIADLPLFPTKLGELFSDFLLSPIATNLVVPLLIALAAIILKKLARPGGLQSEDWVVGFELGVGACVTLLVSSLVLVRAHPKSH